MKASASMMIPVIGLFVSCQSGENGEWTVRTADTVYVDDYFTGLFGGDCDGFTGGDGTYSVELPDGRTVWLFGDTFIGGLNPDNTREKQIPRFIRNSAIVMDGDSMKTLYQRRNGTRASFAIPPSAPGSTRPISEDSLWYWPGDGFIEEGRLKIFLSEFIKTDTGMWGFQWLGTWIASYSLPDLEEEKIEPIPFSRNTRIHFGHAVHVDDPFTYVYGLGDGRPHVARYTSGDVHQPWEFFHGSGWSTDPSEAVPMADFEGSEQFSVFKDEGVYILITQMGGFSDEICSFTARTPYGPWGNQQLLYKTPLPDSTMELITYNAVAHPQFTEQGMLLISYNMNSMFLEDHYRYAWIYRPRFIRVPLKMILGKVKN